MQSLELARTAQVFPFVCDWVTGPAYLSGHLTPSLAHTALQTEKCVSSFQTLSPEPSLFRGAHPKTILPLLQDKDHSQIFDWGPSPRQLLCPLCLGCRIIPKSFVYPGPGEQAARL